MCTKYEYGREATRAEAAAMKRCISPPTLFSLFLPFSAFFRLFPAHRRGVGVGIDAERDWLAGRRTKAYIFYCLCIFASLSLPPTSPWHASCSLCSSPFPQAPHVDTGTVRIESRWISGQRCRGVRRKSTRGQLSQAQFRASHDEPCSQPRVTLVSRPSWTDSSRCRSHDGAASLEPAGPVPAAPTSDELEGERETR